MPKKTMYVPAQPIVPVPSQVAAAPASVPLPKEAPKVCRCGSVYASYASLGHDSQWLAMGAVTPANPWGKDVLRYYVAPQGTWPREEFEALAAEAFSKWHEVCGVKPRASLRKTPAVSIVVVATSLDPTWEILGQGDVPKFRKPGQRCVATISSDIVTMADPQKDLLLVATLCHEIGHTLGLRHSTMPGALMYPLLRPEVTSPQPFDDKPRVRKLYGPAVLGTST